MKSSYESEGFHNSSLYLQIKKSNSSDVHHSQNVNIGSKSSFAVEAIYEAPSREVETEPYGT